jgi:glutamine synthetase
MLEDAFVGNGYEATNLPRIPATIVEAIELWKNSAIARECFGDDVHHHILTMAQTEWDAFNKSVTDWERKRYFELI